jgi:hypothetical protein
MRTREQELKEIEEYIKEKGVIKLPPDERIKMCSSEVWKKTSDKFKKKKGRKPKK